MYFQKLIQSHRAEFRRGLGVNQSSNIWSGSFVRHKQVCAAFALSVWLFILGRRTMIVFVETPAGKKFHVDRLGTHWRLIGLICISRYWRKWEYYISSYSTTSWFSMTVIDFLSSPDYLWIITNWNSVWNILAFFSRLWKFVTLQSYFQLAESGVLAYEEQASTTWSTHSSIESSSRRALPRPPSVRHVFGRFPLSFLKRVQYIIAVITCTDFQAGHLKSAVFL